MATGSAQRIGVGTDGVAAAARLTGVSSACIRRWPGGFAYETAAGRPAESAAAAAWRPSSPSREVVGFILDGVE